MSKEAVHDSSGDIFADLGVSPPEWAVPCCECGRLVDTREQSEGGGPDGCELSDKRWVCTIECYDKATGYTA